MTRFWLWAACLAVPVAGFALLLSAPKLDLHWQHNPSHFWLVVGVGVLNLLVGLVLSEAARRRGDARVFLIALALLTSAGFLTLHALATPDVLVNGSSAAFIVASPVGLFLAAGFLAASSLELSREQSLAIVSRSGLIIGAVLALMVAWAVVVLAEAPPLDRPLKDDDAVLIGLGAAGFVLYAIAVIRYAALYRRRRAFLLLAVLTALVLLAEAMLAVAFSRSWHATWWEWHLLMLAAFVLVALAVRAEWRASGPADALADIYLEETRASVRDISVLFADLEGFTAFTERSSPEECFLMLNTYFAETLPVVADGCGGTVDKLIGDAIMVTFNARGDQPDHALLAARCALALQEAAAEVARPGWPRFRAGVNTGRAMVGLVGAKGHRSYTVVGDTVNLAARLEGTAEAGGVVIGEATREALGDAARVTDLGGVQVKGKEQPVRAFALLELDR